MNRDEALAIFAALLSDEEWPESLPLPYNETVFLPPSLLGELTITDVPIDVTIGVGVLHDDAIEVFWEGRLMRTEDGSLLAFISHEISPEYWLGSVNARFYLDLVRKCLLSSLATINGLAIDDYDDSDDRMLRLDYSFPVDGLNLRDAFEKATQIQHDLELPADRVVDDVTKALARSADRILRGHYAKPAELVAQVDAAETAMDKGHSLELLMEALFAQVPGFVVYERNLRTETEEIDLVVVNGSLDPVYSRDGSIILVECKNWTGRPGRPEFSLLESKIRNRHNRCTIAFFVSWSGFAETIPSEALRTSRDDYVIVCLAGADIRQAALVGNFPDFLREATLRALTV
jgi:hypothetical protein